MFSGSALAGSNLGNATMPGEGSLHQIREALHLQDVGQATAALQKPTASQQKPQSRAMAGPCHLVQDDIPSHQWQPKCVSPNCARRLPRAGAGRPSPALAVRSVPDSRMRDAGALSRAWPRPSVAGLQECRRGRHRSQWQGHRRPLSRGRYRRSELHRGRRCMAGLCGAPARGAPRTGCGRRLFPWRARGSETHLRAEDRQTRVRLSARLHTLRPGALSLSASLFPNPDPSPETVEG